ncbi:helix-turn-helix domain-containing protein [bacterium]|nr:helix-turn-helix domain-containing protein [bacterium]
MTNENSPNMGPFISELRKEKNLTQRELADQLGVTDKAVSKWERGLSYPDISLLSKLAGIFGINTGELLNGKRANSAPQPESHSEETASHATCVGEGPTKSNVRRKRIAIGFGVGLMSALIFIACRAAIESGLSWVFLPLGITTSILVMAILVTFIAGKNKISALLLSGTVLYLTTYYYSSLIKSPVSMPSNLGAFPRLYLPHYTIEIILFVVSIALIAVTIWIRNKNNAGDIHFLLATGSLTILILSPLTVSAIVDYVDLNGLGVDPRFTILVLLTLLINLILLAAWVRRFIKQSDNPDSSADSHA